MRKITAKDVPWMIEVATRPSEEPLIREWKERNQAVEKVVRTRPMVEDDLVDTSMMTQSDLWEMEEDLEKLFRYEVRWEVPRTSEKYEDAKRELFAICNMINAAQGLYTFSLRRYNQQREKLIKYGYSIDAIEHVPAPPAPIPLLHDCGGEIHSGLFTNKYGEVKKLFCTQCHFIWWNEVSVSYAVDISSLHGGKGAILIQPNPDYPCYEFMRDLDEAGIEEIRKEEEYGKEITRRSLKTSGILLSVKEAAGRLGTTTQNVSNYIAKQRLHAWKDPDDTRYRLVLREEVEALR
jgi:hypothetical protein